HIGNRGEPGRIIYVVYDDRDLTNRGTRVNVAHREPKPRRTKEVDVRRERELPGTGVDSYLTVFATIECILQLATMNVDGVQASGDRLVLQSPELSIERCWSRTILVATAQKDEHQR